MMLLGIVLSWPHAASAYMVGLPQDLEKMSAEADVIFKGTVVSSGPVEDGWFKPYAGFEPYETRFTIVSVIKGDAPGAALSFHHYDNSPAGGAANFAPQVYHFEKERAYLVFAKKSDRPGIFRQLWVFRTGIPDQGTFRCANATPVSARSPSRRRFGAELMRSLRVPAAADVIYAIQHLDQMSDGGRDFDKSTKDFDRLEVLKAIHGLMTNADSKIAQAAIGVVGAHNPYMSDEFPESWLATAGSARTPGYSPMDANMKNTGGASFWKDLQAIASSTDKVAETRALAIRALGFVREPALRETISVWATDREPVVRAAAAVLLADFPGTQTNGAWTALDADTSPLVRVSVALAIGYSQQEKLIQVLGGLLGDPDPLVRRIASVSLLSFSPKSEVVAQVFRDNLDKKEFAPLFLNALSCEDPSHHLDDLAHVVETNVRPENWSGGEIPAFTAWKALFKCLQSQTPAALASGKLDRYLDAMEKLTPTGSGEPCSIYAFYLLNGMPERAKKFREKANKAVGYDLDLLFKRVDENPAAYRLE